jgi:hypothetical protein
MQNKRQKITKKINKILFLQQKNNMPAKEKYKKEQHLLVLPAS